MAATAGATGPQIVNWGTDPADELTAESIAAGALGVLKAQQPSDDAWLTLAPTLMNPIRENRSAALQAYLIAQRDGSGALDLRRRGWPVRLLPHRRADELVPGDLARRPGLHCRRRPSSSDA